MPNEIKEKILSFTYKTQPKELLAELMEYGEMKSFLADFAVLVDRSNHSEGFNETTDNIYGLLWPGLNIIRTSRFNKKLLKWRYAKEFRLAQEEHSNGAKCFRLLNWKISFAVYFWMCIYH